ncbi:phosphopantetheine-binding protein [Streptomyces paromomycinus]|uniref:Non-ribosomal peptide synthetase n=1 Tax=Streptomyces paromomycinus TaxID=92743 RepID=A0A401W573_STREY|nr:phosphopantetheine-binding protein [Streptomyces paromomycinus]GCD44446.1 non-ribosomal peptide synthetase [Streptomyces paromomycinus]
MSEMTQDKPILDEARSLIPAWATELLEEPATLEDNFLDLGGHSVLALELSNRIKERFGAEVDIQILFEKNLAEVASEVARLTGTPVQSG